MPVKLGKDTAGCVFGWGAVVTSKKKKSYDELFNERKLAN